MIQVPSNMPPPILGPRVPAIYRALASALLGREGEHGDNFSFGRIMTSCTASDFELGKPTVLGPLPLLPGDARVRPFFPLGLSDRAMTNPRFVSSLRS